VAHPYAVCRDVTREKEREETLRQSQKVEAKGRLTGGVAHDFNNLLTPIIGALDMLQRKELGGKREQRLIGGAALSAEKAKTLVQRLLAFVRRQPLQPRSIENGELTRGMAELIASTTGPQIKVIADAPTVLPPGRADPNQLEMAILNLAVNARDAMPEGGTLGISVEALTIGRQHRSKLQPGRYLHLSVADTGVGMDEATRARGRALLLNQKAWKRDGSRALDGARARLPARRGAHNPEHARARDQRRALAAAGRHCAAGQSENGRGLAI
jgi:signal transduction histidine kinase